MRRKDVIFIAYILHDLQDLIGGDWYEVVDAFVINFVNRNEFPASVDANEFRRLAAGGKP